MSEGRQGSLFNTHEPQTTNSAGKKAWFGGENL